MNNKPKNKFSMAGPFYNLAKTYWTFRIQVFDITPESIDFESMGEEAGLDVIMAQPNKAILKILNKIEQDVATLFFPTPGPYLPPEHLRKDAQKEYLQEYARDKDKGLWNFETK
ncbi:MAG: hypothetical protein KKB81_07170 [Candidatus Margulisbacteria bacterium]|nr:hypothetical protein [Candidatus Margulisiibacteriota bacterium]MBU1022338.1 hypothetical protein [Candidatus Margulisiibacteriota bacterium]MBU1728404.1 hypothetical protein [Candidatus Margulisiibacteriota bacterium]MBU1955235.1 hypothetical protein [Candidatus Margulisiibacteriota bacterium]